MADTFEKLADQAIAEALQIRGITTPTAVQEQAIPQLSSGRDVIVSAETGSGKTLAYLIPLLRAIDPAVRAAQVVVLVPTHELAAQVHREAERLMAEAHLEMSAALVIGGANIQRQLDVLKKKPQLIVGSAGRLLELATLKKLVMHYVRTIVLDEADKLLDDNNIETVRALIGRTLRDRQLAAFSASITAQAEATAQAMMRDPVVIRVQARAELPQSISHMAVASIQREKAALLRKVFHAEKIQKGIVFVNNAHHITIAAERLRNHGVPSATLYGDAFPNERRRALEDFRTGRAALLVASDMASRGLDVPGVTHVINLDLPEQPELYLHRAGRTGRMGAPGKVVTLATPRELAMLQKYARTYHFAVEERTIAEGRLRNETETAQKPAQANRPAGKNIGNMGATVNQPPGKVNRATSDAGRNTKKPANKGKKERTK